MKFRFTKHQVSRGARPDAETFDTLLLIKRVSSLRATYQIRLLTYRAVQEGRKLEIEVPKTCRLEYDLKELAAQNRDHLKITRA
jgi:hypothetical protein